MKQPTEYLVFGEIYKSIPQEPLIYTLNECIDNDYSEMKTRILEVINNGFAISHFKGLVLEIYNSEVIE